ncbi:ATP-binding protein [Lacinutrix neustonica]|uniref:ATP-binding protein n=1 Tax=Lacinutrix neustonica TaxID=2980107 RepID=A0A9E8SGY0_9FLAO|nr:ATP-binding protein [Lacinutrix neustonica]WAC02165.1 ATP-binding protein [Lacinutrix neustonica]
MIDREEIVELLRIKANGNLYHREGQTVEFKEQFNFAGLADYFKDFSAFSNNKGGYLIFGITDSPRKATGLSDQSENQFEKIDPKKLVVIYLIFFRDILNGNKN